MYSVLGEEILKSGERMEVGVVRGPDAEWLPVVAPFLGHKTPDYRAHIQGALEGPLDSLQSRFYVGRVGDRVISQIMIVGDRGCGILGHVYTRPEERRKGACAHIMRHQMADCAAAGFRVLCLGTGFESAPYWIYHSFGFRSIGPGSGCMKWLAHPDAERELLRPAAASVRALQWDDWGYLDLIAFQPVHPAEELPRSSSMGLKGQGSLEGPFVSFQARRRREPEIQARALVAESGATTGWAILAPDPRWHGDAWLLDVHALPGFEGSIPELIAGLEWPAAPAAAYVTRPGGPRAAALEGAGFRPAAELPGFLRAGEERRAVVIWARAV